MTIPIYRKRSNLLGSDIITIDWTPSSLAITTIFWSLSIAPIGSHNQSTKPLVCRYTSILVSRCRTFLLHKQMANLQWHLKICRERMNFAVFTENTGWLNCVFGVQTFVFAHKICVKGILIRDFYPGINSLRKPCRKPALEN